MSFIKSTLLAIATLASGLHALGINCEGSSECDFSMNNALGAIFESMQTASNQGYGNTVFTNGGTTSGAYSIRGKIIC
jgi:hypothetical protein